MQTPSGYPFAVVFSRSSTVRLLRTYTSPTSNFPCSRNFPWHASISLTCRRLRNSVRLPKLRRAPKRGHVGWHILPACGDGVGGIRTRWRADIATADSTADRSTIVSCRTSTASGPTHAVSPVLLPRHPRIDAAAAGIGDGRCFQRDAPFPARVPSESQCGGGGGAGGRDQKPGVNRGCERCRRV